jgi:hypothetical protein
MSEPRPVVLLDDLEDARLRVRLAMNAVDAANAKLGAALCRLDDAIKEFKAIEAARQADATKPENDRLLST